MPIYLTKNKFFFLVSGINPFLYLPTSVLVCKDRLSTYRFEETIGSVSAQELGHDILWTIPKTLKDSWRWSWFHKNTSSLTQPLLSAPKYPFPIKYESKLCVSLQQPMNLQVLEKTWT